VIITVKYLNSKNSSKTVHTKKGQKAFYGFHPKLIFKPTVGSILTMTSMTVTLGPNTYNAASEHRCIFMHKTGKSPTKIYQTIATKNQTCPASKSNALQYLTNI